MATIPSHPAPSPAGGLSPHLSLLLRRLRQRIQQYVLWEGLGSLVALVGVLFWGTLLIDTVYFQLTHLELPQWFRGLCGMLMLVGLASAAASWIVFRYFRSFRATALALVLERRFPELKDRLLTAVEMSETPRSQFSPVTLAMLDRTVADVTDAARSLELGSVFDRAPLRRSTTAAIVAITSVLALALFNTPALARWTEAFVDLEATYWPRETQLVVRVLAQPGDRVREFVDGQYKHPRGSDLTLLVEVLEEHRVPNRVQLRYRAEAGRGGGRVSMFQLGEREFKHSINGLLDNVDLWVQGGDYTNREPLRVVVVDPPRVDRISLDSLFPAYTRLNAPAETDGQVARTPVPVQGTQASLPLETDFILQAETNKSLARVSLRSRPFELTLIPKGYSQEYPGTDVAELLLKSDDGSVIDQVTLPTARGESLFGEDRRTFRVPLVMATHASERLADFAQQASWPLPIPADTLLRLDLEDEDGILTTEPTRLTVNGRVDSPPVVDVELTGVGNAITRKASIPVQGGIKDDYGIVTARFQYAIDDREAMRPRPFKRRPEGVPTQFTLGQAVDDPIERFEVLPLDLAVGQTLFLTVTAVDGDDQNGPHEANGEVFRFQIVTDEELLSLLYSKELNLRRRFEQIFGEVQQTRNELTTLDHRIRDTESTEIRDADFASLGTAVSERALHSIRKNASETAAIEFGFGEIRSELVNNAIATGQILDRVDRRIVEPLHAINTIVYPKIDGELGVLRLAIQQGDNPQSSLQAALTATDDLLRRMQSVLDEMQDLLEYHEAIEFLKRIIDLEAGLIEKTREERKRKLLEGLLK